MKQTAKLGLFGLIGVVISSMVGAGVFSLPQNMAKGAGAGAVLIAWVITGIGMYFIVATFRTASDLNPHMRSGIYAFAQEGFGEKVGFFAAWGYWLCNISAITGYAVIMMESLNYFFPPYFQGGNNLNSLILSTIIVWGYFLLASRGIRAAALVNLVGTACKLIPIITFILVCLTAFRLYVFMPDIKHMFAGGIGAGEILTQVKSTMFITLWCFIGVETAIAISGRAGEQRDISRATKIAFLTALTLYILISVLPFGILPRETLAAFPNPSTAGVLESIIGRAGGLLMTAGLIISVSFSWLSWFIIASEVPSAAAKGGAPFPKQFAYENKREAPTFSLVVTGLLIQGGLFLAFFSEHAWESIINVTGVIALPVYTMTALYLFKFAGGKKFPEAKMARGKARTIAVLGALYSLWLIYAANIRYLLMGVFLLVLGVPVYLLAVKQRKGKTSV